MTGDHNLTQLHLDTALGQCQAYILLNSTLQSEHPDVTTLIINLCANNCSNKGACLEGTHSCIKNSHSYKILSSYSLDDPSI